jgi:carbamoyltransferase
MLVIGFSGAYDPGDEREPFCADSREFHDSAAVLVEDGRVVCAIEQERVDRIKHSNKFPAEAIRECLRIRGIPLSAVDRIAYCWDDKHLDRAWAVRFLDHLDGAYTTTREKIERAFRVTLDADVSAQLCFVRHHQAHIESAISLSGFDSCLALSIDALGDNNQAGQIVNYRDGELKVLLRIHEKDSLGWLYHRALPVLGYRPFDEYKVMGLAPYGDPARFSELFAQIYELREAGGYALLPRMPAVTAQLLEIHRRPGQPIGDVHRDFAAALQQALEKIVLHVLRHYQATTGQRALALAGGVAHNCSMNGEILRSGIFEEVFVQPAAHDAGAALGAALHVCRAGAPLDPKRPTLRNMYWGAELPPKDDIGRTLASWKPLVDCERLDGIVERTADLLAEGAVIGWVQGRSEFGPRALGNRSILADPRPAENKTRINAMVKKREGYRPFAPSVVEERAAEFFSLPAGVTRLPFMIFVTQVREDKRSLLGAITHIDGTARVQTVAEKDNARYWQLLNAFGRRTGVPMLLNTSFNNNVEPIVETVEDALACFLTTKIDYLVVDDFLVRKRPIPSLKDFAHFVPSLPRHVFLTSRLAADGRRTRAFESTVKGVRPISPATAALNEALERMDGRKTLGELLGSEGSDAVRDDLLQLWSNRVLVLRPAHQE